MATEQPEQCSDEALIAGILKGESRCFTALHGRYSGRIYSYALKRLGDPFEAEDVTQDVFLQVHLCLASFRGSSSLLTWMFGIAHHQVGRRTRRRHRDALPLYESQVRYLPSREVRVDKRLAVARLLARCNRLLLEQVTDSQQRVFKLRYTANESTASIARQLGTTPNAVKLSLSRTRRTLSLHVGEELAAELS